MTVENGAQGIYLYFSKPTISKCVIRYSKGPGGAAISGSSSLAIIENCVIRENRAGGISGCDGPIQYCEIRENSGSGISSCHGLVSDCNVVKNGGFGFGTCDGEIRACNASGNTNSGIYSCTGQIRECVIIGNGSTGIVDGREILNCLISGNNGDGCSYNIIGGNNTVTITNCTIIGNTLRGVQSSASASSQVIANNIIVKNGQYGVVSNANVTLKYNNIWGNLSGNYSVVAPGTTDLHVNPLFTLDGYWDIGNKWIEGDYRLKSVAGHWTTAGWVSDTVTSPCIDAGDPTGSYFIEPMPNGHRINQGYDGGTIYASKSPYGPEPYCSKSIPGDVNLDCQLNFTDFAIIATHWLECNLQPQSACWQ
jgi:hypothetical protein